MPEQISLMEEKKQNSGRAEGRRRSGYMICDRLRGVEGRE